MKKALVVDNHPVMLKFMTDLLAKKGYQVARAEDGLTALGILKGYVPDVVFVDLVMPKIGGEKLCRIIRRNPDLEHVYLVILSAIAGEIDLNQSGAQAFVAKGPFNKMKKNILDVLKRMDRGDQARAPHEVLGLEQANHEVITRELLSSKQHAEIIMRNLSEGLLELSLEGRIIYANDAAITLISAPEEAILGTPFEELFAPPARERIQGYLKGVDRERNGVVEGSPLSLKDKTVTFRIFAIRDDEHSSLIVILNDITEQNLAEDALQVSKERYLALVESSSDAILMMDSRRVIVSCNRAFLEMFGYDRKEIEGQSIRIIHQSEESFRGFGESAYPVVENEGAYRTEWDFVHRGGQTIPVESVTSMIRSADGSIDGYVAIMRDISERKRKDTEKVRLEAQLRQAQKMEAIGTLAGGIAHNFNNILMGIQGNATLMMLDTDSSDPHYERLDTIKRSVQSGARLTDQLLGYAREGKFELKPIALNHLVEDMIRAFSATRTDIKIQLQLSDEADRVEADYGQIEQMLWNLCVNAAEAVANGGDITISTENISHHDMRDKPYKPKSGRYILLTVEDTGAGMDQKTMERVFDPFFTTKDMSKVTGLGLASAYGNVKAHGGYIDVSSEEGRGTVFRVYLPASEMKVFDDVQKEERFMGGSENILLVDDEELVLEVGSKTLTALGYNVHCAQSGEEAVELYQSDKTGIDVVLLDMIMPGMSGSETFDRLRSLNPELKVVLTSGYTLEGQATAILNRGCDAFFQKPFELADLSHKLRELLDDK